MHRHYTYFMQWFPGEAGSVGEAREKFLCAVLIGAILLLLGWLAARRIRTAEGRKKELVPSKGFSLFGFFDVFIEGFVAFHDSILGEKNRQYVPLCGSVFLFVFCANLVGLVPGMPASTATVGVNVGIALVVFIAFNLFGIREHGPIGYLKHFFGGPELVKFPMVIVGLAVCLLEMLSTVLRVLTLNLRLYWNISADHIVLGAMTKLVPYGVPVFFYVMGTFVCLMQAFVFTVLTMVYILLATQHGEEEH